MVEANAPLTTIIILLTSVVSYLGFVRPSVRERFIFDSQLILRERQYHRMVSSALLHADPMHLVLNMYSLYAFGSVLERLFESPTLLAIYLASIVGGSTLALVFHRQHQYRALGASGGVAGIVFAAIFLLPGGRIRMFFPPLVLPAWLYALFFVGASFYGIRSRTGNIGHDAHLGGALVGP